MITEFKNQFSNTATMFDVAYTTKNHGEYEEYAQGYNYANASVNLIPVKKYSAERTIAGVTRYKGSFEIYFLKKFVESDSADGTKDVIIDEMILLSEAFYAQLDQNQYLLFNQGFFKWEAEIVRQYTANLLCGVKVTVGFDTACNRLDGSEPIPSLPATVRNSDGSYSITFESKDSPFTFPDTTVSLINSIDEVISTDTVISKGLNQTLLIPDIQYQVGANPIVEIPYTNALIVIPDDCPTLTAQYNAASDAERITLFQGLSAQNQLDIYSGLTDAERLALFVGLPGQDQIDLYNALSDALRLSLFNALPSQDQNDLYDGLSNALRLQLFNYISNAKKEQLVFYTYNYGQLYTGAVTSYQTGDDKHQWDNIYSPEINTWPTDRVWVFPILDPTNFSLLKRGATASGNNIFGNLQRFTDDAGGQTYTSGVLIDHYLGIMMDITFSAVQASWSAAITASVARNFYSKTDWRLGNTLFWNLFIKRSQGGNYLSGLPSVTFSNTPANSGLRRVWTSTSDDGDRTTLAAALFLRQATETAARNITSTTLKSSSDIQNLYVRKCFTYNSGTGLMALS